MPGWSVLLFTLKAPISIGFISHIVLILWVIFNLNFFVFFSAKSVYQTKWVILFNSQDEFGRYLVIPFWNKTKFLFKLPISTNRKWQLSRLFNLLMYLPIYCCIFFVSFLLFRRGQEARISILEDITNHLDAGLESVSGYSSSNKISNKTIKINFWLFSTFMFLLLSLVLYLIFFLRSINNSISQSRARFLRLRKNRSPDDLDTHLNTTVVLL